MDPGWLRGKPPFGTLLDHAHPLVRGLTECWTFEERAGGILRPALGRYPGTLQGGVPWSTGPAGGQLTFNGNSHYVDFTPSPDLSGQVSICALISRSDNDEAQIVASAAPAVQQLCFGINRTAGKIHSQWGNVVHATGATTLDIGEWYHVALTRGGTAAANWDHKLFVGGVVDASANPGTEPSGPAAMAIGRLGSVSNLEFGGKIASVWLWHRGLTPPEVLEHARDPFGMFVRPKGRRIFIPAGGGPGPEEKIFAETGAGTDAVTLAAAQSLSETGAGADSLSAVDQGNTVTFPESAPGAAALGVAAAVTLGEGAPGTDSLTAVDQGNTVTFPEGAPGTETLALSAAIGLSEGAPGTDAFALAAALTLAESAPGTDALSAVDQGNVANFLEGAPGTAALAVTAAQSLSEGAPGTDVLAASAGPVLAEGAPGTDALIALDQGNVITFADGAPGSAALAVSAAILLQISGAGQDALLVGGQPITLVGRRTGGIPARSATGGLVGASRTGGMVSDD